LAIALHGIAGGLPQSFNAHPLILCMPPYTLQKRLAKLSVPQRRVFGHYAASRVNGIE
jgi:hypothetical protein